MRILVLDTPQGALNPLIAAFGDAISGDKQITRVTSCHRMIERIKAGLPWDLAVLDYELGDGRQTGGEILATIRAVEEEMPIVVVADHGDVDIAMTAIKAGANDFLVRTGDLIHRVDTLLKKIQPQLTLIHNNRILREQNMLLREAKRDQYRLIGESAQILGVIAKVERVARIPRPVLIVGERGTGKELVARAIHSAAHSLGSPMVVINCAAYTDSLLETELFGHEKGAFTGADSLVYGKFEMAAGGTLFLDEVGNMSLPFQQKILRVVEYGTFTRVGGNNEVRTDTRIIAATNADLRIHIQEGKFLHDLYDRLSFEIIEVPPLRQRNGDIPLLARHFLNRFMGEIPSLRGKRLSSEAISTLGRYSFPGNVRELKNIIERAAYRDTTNEITPEDLGLLPQPTPGGEGASFGERVERFKARLVHEALEQAAGNQARAARAVGLSYHQFRYLLKKASQGGPHTTSSEGVAHHGS